MVIIHSPWLTAPKTGGISLELTMMRASFDNKNIISWHLYCQENQPQGKWVGGEKAGG